MKLEADLWTQRALRGAESLIRCGKLNLEDWGTSTHPLPPSLLPVKTETATVSEIAIVTLPVALFFHDHFPTLQEKLTLVTTHWRSTDEVPLETWVMGYAIAQALTEKLAPANLIPQILTSLDQGKSPLIEQLIQVQTLVEQRASLNTAITQLCRHTDATEMPIALAFYCFLSTPEDFRLSVIRAARTGYQPQTTTALTGILSGVYNSLIGIPLTWRLALNSKDRSELLHLASCLLAAWSGVYSPAMIQEEFPQAAIAAPRVIQPRQGGG